MNTIQIFSSLRSMASALGPTRLITLGIGLVAVLATLGVTVALLARPESELLYAGLSRDDVGRIGTALRAANTTFDVSADGSSISVPAGRAAAARMTLAEKGLPTGGTAGYELFDKIGSLGLTSFMQEVTKMRALEGELARSIQTLRGIRAARVHIVAADEGSFRRAQQPASASVVVQADPGDAASAAPAIRHLVAAAVPGMRVDHVTVLDTDGTVLASGEDPADAPSGKMMAMERQLAQSIQESIRRTLAPYLSIGNFVVSVSARINTDRKQINETIFNPESRIERSVRVVRESQTSQNSDGQPNASVERNIPGEGDRNTDARRNSEDSQKREETTNYEVSSKTIATASGGYAIERISVALLVNSASFEGTADAERDTRMAEIEQLAASAAGLQPDRGDTIKLAAVAFSDTGGALTPAPPEGLLAVLTRQLAGSLKALAIAGVAALLILVVIRPMVQSLLRSLEASRLAAAAPVPERPALASPAAEGALPAPGADPAPDAAQSALLADLSRQSHRAPQKKLAQMIAFDERQAAAVLRQWLRDGEAA